MTGSLKDRRWARLRPCVCSLKTFRCADVLAWLTRPSPVQPTCLSLFSRLPYMQVILQPNWATRSALRLCKLACLRVCFRPISSTWTSLLFSFSHSQFFREAFPDFLRSGFTFSFESPQHLDFPLKLIICFISVLDHKNPKDKVRICFVYVSRSLASYTELCIYYVLNKHILSETEPAVWAAGS